MSSPIFNEDFCEENYHNLVFKSTFVLHSFCLRILFVLAINKVFKSFSASCKEKVSIVSGGVLFYFILFYLFVPQFLHYIIITTITKLRTTKGNGEGQRYRKYMLFTSREVRIGKNCARRLGYRPRP